MDLQCFLAFATLIHGCKHLATTLKELMYLRMLGLYGIYTPEFGDALINIA